MIPPWVTSAMLYVLLGALLLELVDRRNAHRPRLGPVASILVVVGWGMILPIAIWQIIRERGHEGLDD